MKIQESAENYLETILILSERSTYVRSIDIANEAQFYKTQCQRSHEKAAPRNNLITVDGDGYIHLTEDGLAIANRMYERHKLLSDWLTYLGVPKDIATEDACRIEHVISQESFEKIRAHVREMNEHL